MAELLKIFFFSTGAAIALSIGYLLKPIWIAALLCILFYLLLEPLVSTLQAASVRKDLAIASALLPPLIGLVYGAAHLIDSARDYLPQLGRDLEQLQLGISQTLAQLDDYLAVVMGIQLSLAEQVASLELDLRGAARAERLLDSIF